MFNKILIANRGDPSRRDAATQSNSLRAQHAQAVSSRETRHV
ncbi:MAG: hypothetical protein Q8R51_03070 [Azonexus sp.]|nr:hypothetical protein [Azonexus sp.]